MKTVTMLDVRLNAEKILAQVQKGQRVVLTRRGKPVARLEPMLEDSIGPDDSFYSIGELSAPGGGSLSNSEIDATIYGQ
jgi:prevent-host-death family protein